MCGATRPLANGEFRPVTSLIRLYSAARPARPRFYEVVDAFGSDRFVAGSDQDLAFSAALRSAGLESCTRFVDVLSVAARDLDATDSLHLDIELDRGDSVLAVDTEGCCRFRQRSAIRIDPRRSRKLDLMQLMHERPLYVLSRRMAEALERLGSGGFSLAECQRLADVRARGNEDEGFLQRTFEHTVEPPSMPSWVRLGPDRKCATCGRYDVPSLYGAIYPHAPLGECLFGMVDRVLVEGEEYALQIPRPLVSGRVLAEMRRLKLSGSRAAFRGVRYSGCLVARGAWSRLRPDSR